MEERKIFVIGPTGSGKTFLAKKVSGVYKIPHINLDYVLYRHTKAKQREEIPEVEWKKKLGKITKNDKWVIDGVNPIDEVIKRADKVIYLRLNMLETLISQWKRYLTDPVQRMEHGFINNLKLSKYLIKQHWERENVSKSNDPKYARVRKYDRIFKDYPDKTLILKTRKEVNSFIDTL